MAQNELQLVTFTQAKRLKAAGFDWETTYNYSTLYGTEEELLFMFSKVLQRVPVPLNWNSTDVVRQDAFSAPTVALALKWFRDVKGYVYSMNIGVSLAYKTYYHPIWSNRNMIEMDSDFKRCGSFAILEDAESALLNALLDRLEASETACE